MNREEILKRIRTIEIATKGLRRDLYSGQYKTAFKGRGMSFAEVRDYQYGDEIRTIDWNVTARYNTPYVKVFEEERELSVMVLVDVSASFYYGTDHHSKIEKAVEFLATIAFSALVNNDKTGAIFFSNDVECYIPPKKGREHILYMIDRLIAFNPVHKGTTLSAPLKALRQTQKKRAICFLVTDFVDESLNLDELYLTKKYHDLIGVKINDPSEKELRIPAIYQVVNPETGKTEWINGFSQYFKRAFKSNFLAHEEKVAHDLKTRGIPLINLQTNTSIIEPLTAFFNQRK